MKTKYLLAVAAMFLTAAGAARAEDGPYISASVGAYMGNDFTHAPIWRTAKGDTDKKYNSSIAGGYRLDDFRFEGEVGYGRLANVTGNLAAISVTPGFRANGGLTAWTALAGAYYDMPVTRTYQPYVGLGGGIADLKSDSDLLVVKEGTHAAAFAEAGLNMVVWDGLTIAPGYRYLWINSKGGGADNVSSHIVKLTARTSF